MERPRVLQHFRPQSFFFFPSYVISFPYWRYLATYTANPTEDATGGRPRLAKYKLYWLSL